VLAEPEPARGLRLGLVSPVGAGQEEHRIREDLIGLGGSTVPFLDCFKAAPASWLFAVYSMLFTLNVNVSTFS